jgi:hypothetical protein
VTSIRECQSLSVDLPHLHGILKDKTRASILEHLEQRGKLSYVELQNLLQVPHTGKLNYDMKVLGDLISKDENGQYGLSEKGRVAVALLGKFQTKSESSAAALKVKLKLRRCVRSSSGNGRALSIFRGDWNPGLIWYDQLDMLDRQSMLGELPICNNFHTDNACSNSSLSCHHRHFWILQAKNDSDLACNSRAFRFLIYIAVLNRNPVLPVWSSSNYSDLCQQA